MMINNETEMEMKMDTWTRKEKRGKIENDYPFDRSFVKFKNFTAFGKLIQY